MPYCASKAHSCLVKSAAWMPEDYRCCTQAYNQELRGHQSAPPFYSTLPRSSGFQTNPTLLNTVPVSSVRERDLSAFDFASGQRVLGRFCGEVGGFLLVETEIDSSCQHSYLEARHWVVLVSSDFMEDTCNTVLVAIESTVRGISLPDSCDSGPGFSKLVCQVVCAIRKQNDSVVLHEIVKGGSKALLLYTALTASYGRMVLLCYLYYIDCTVHQIPD